MTRILFVCHGNICRSPMAEFVMKELAQRAEKDRALYIASAATSGEELGNPVYPPARRILMEHGIDCAGKLARRIRPADYEAFDLLIGMDDENLRDMERLFGGDSAGKLHRLLEYDGRPGADLPDPWYTRDFESTWRDVYAGCFGLLRELFPQITLDFSGCSDRAGLYGELRRRMLWEDWYGESLDALHDILTGLRFLGKSFVFIMPVASAEQSCRDYAERIFGEFVEAGLPAAILTNNMDKAGE